MLNKKYFIYKIASILIIIISILISSFIWFFSLQYYNNLLQKTFEYRVSENIDNLNQRISHYKYALISGAALINTNENMTSKVWHDFISSLDLEKNYPGFQALGYSPVISAENIASFIKEMQINNPSFEMFPSKKSNLYVPVKYIEPKNDRNNKAIGYNLYSETTRKEVLDSARDTGLASLSDKVVLRQEIDDNIQAGILMYVPVYKNNQKNTIEDRRNSIIGFVSGVFRMNDLMQNIVLDQSILDFEIFDNKEQKEENLLYKSFNETQFEAKFFTNKEIKVNDKIWYISFYSTKEFENNFNYSKPLFLTFFGISLYFVLLLIILFMIRSKKLLQIKSKELEKVNKDLLLSKKKYKTLVDQSLTGIYLYQENKFIFANNHFCEIFDYSENEIISTIKPSDILKNKNEFSIDEKSLHYITSSSKKDGTLIWLEVYENIIDIEGKATISGIAIDISQIIEAQEKFENLFNFSNIGLAITTPQKAWLQVNNKILKILGYSKEELFNTTWDKISYDEDLEKDLDLFNDVLSGKIDNYQIEKKFIKKDGDIVETILTLSAYKRNNEIEYLLASMLDITDTKMKENLLIQQSKLAAMGEMIAIIAHQWKQPLSLISTSSTGMKLQLEMDMLTKEFSIEALDSIIKATKHLSHTIDDFRDFFKPKTVKTTFNINESISKSLKLISSGFKNKEISIIKNIDDIYITSYENDLIQILINILNNAKDALLNVNTQRLIFLSVSISEDNKNLIILIKDSAGGIPSDILDKIFEPYFTTKDDKNGTGIGLYIVSEIITKHMKGEIKVNNVQFTYENKDYLGAEFRLIIPLEK
ncbi:CHASE domain-containing protein [Arcobacter sp. s6]|uniref:CHASE domain-containing protein n=1 Tax=Arcobacter sp. s6 TaxID=3230363 RepID=UPI0034A08775